jgi:hypothetical protein
MALFLFTKDGTVTRMKFNMKTFKIVATLYTYDQEDLTKLFKHVLTQLVVDTNSIFAPTLSPLLI